MSIWVLDFSLLSRTISNSELARGRNARSAVRGNMPRAMECLRVVVASEQVRETRIGRGATPAAPSATDLAHPVWASHTRRSRDRDRANARNGGEPPSIRRMAFNSKARPGLLLPAPCRARERRKQGGSDARRSDLPGWTPTSPQLSFARLIRRYARRTSQARSCEPGPSSTRKPGSLNRTRAPVGRSARTVSNSRTG